VNFEKSPKFAVAAATPGPGLGRLAQCFQGSHPKCDNRFHDRGLGCLQAATHDSIRATGTWSRARVGTDSVIGLWKLHGRDSLGVALRGRLIEIQSQYFIASGKHVNRGTISVRWVMGAKSQE